MEPKVRFLPFAPGSMQRRMVVLGVICDDHHPATCTRTDTTKAAKESPASLGIKSAAGFGVTEFAVSNPDGTEVTDAFARWCMLANRIEHLWWHPHSTTTSMLLKMDLIQRPKVDSGISGQPSEFFCVQPAAVDRRRLSEGVVCVAENPSDETAAGTVAHATSLQFVASRRPTRAGHPRVGHRGRNLSDCGAGLVPPAFAPPRSSVADALGDLRRSTLRTQHGRTDAPNTLRFAPHRPMRLPSDDNSSPVPPTTPRATDDRIGIRSCAESRPATQKSSLRCCQCSVLSWTGIVAEPAVMRNYL